MTGEALGGGAVTTTRAFDAGTGRITGITSEDVLDRAIQALGYEWDLVGNLTERTETSAGKMLTETFSYDTLNRLTEAQVSEEAGETTLPVVRTAQTVRYDALGNITCKSDVDGTDCTRAGARNYTYGTGTGRTLTYTTFNKVKRIVKGTHTTDFAYGPDRSRTKRTDTVVTGSGASTTTTLYLGNVEKVSAPDGSFTWKRYIAAGVLVEQTHNTGGARTAEDTRYLLTDHLGSIDVITNVIGTVEQDMSFDAWGQRRAANCQYRLKIPQKCRLKIPHLWIK